MPKLLPFKEIDGGWNPSRGTKFGAKVLKTIDVTKPSANKLVFKKCGCSQVMYIHLKEDNIIFIGCQPRITNIKVVKDPDDPNQLLIKGKRSTKAIKCWKCEDTHLIRSFDEVKDINTSV